MTTPVALTIAGSDPSGGAGIQADLKTFHQFGVYGEAVVTLITVQNTRGIERVEVLDPELVAAQIRAVIGDIRPNAAKTGALGNAAVAAAVAELAAKFDFPLVVDPVMISKHGTDLWGGSMPCVFVTPNLHEASVLAGFAVEDLDSMRRAAKKTAQCPARRMYLIKGGHLQGDAVDMLYTGGEFHEFRGAADRNAGTRTAPDAPIRLRSRRSSPRARRWWKRSRIAKAFVTEAIRTNPGLGGGSGPLNHFVRS